MTTRQQEWQDKRAAQGKCITCGKKHDNGTLRCPTCTRKNNQQKKLRQARRKIMGQCSLCGEEWTGDTIACDDCLAKQRAYTRKWMRGRK